MLNDGLFDMIANDPAVAELSAVGGFMLELPKDFTKLTWSYQTVSVVPAYTLIGPGGVEMNRIQIDCYGRAAEALNLSRAINAKLSGFAGSLYDVEETVIQGIFLSDREEIYDPDPQSVRVMLEYEIYLLNQ